MARFDDATCLGVHPTPKRQRLLEDEQITVSLTVDQDRYSSHVHSPVQQTSPATAEATQSRSEPKATSTPRLAGA